MLPKEFTIHKAVLEDQLEIIEALQFFYVHQHLDWEDLADQLDNGSVFLCHSGQKLQGVLSFSGPTPDNQWVKLFAVRNEAQKHFLWRKLFAFAQEQKNNTVKYIYTIAFWDWYKRLVSHIDSFSFIENIVNLEGDVLQIQLSHTSPIVPIEPSEIDAIHEIDLAAFSPPWQLGRNNLASAIQQSKLSIAIHNQGQIAGYLLSDYADFSAHLSRIAIHPALWGHGLSSQLIEAMFAELRANNILSVSVNTQESNTTSLSLYKKYKFKLTGEKIPIFRYNCANLEEIT